MPANRGNHIVDSPTLVAAAAACAPAPINIGQTINGALATSDCRIDDGTVLDVYSFNGTAGQQISVSMSSTAFDTYLFLLNPDETTLGENDDISPPGDTNSRVPVNGFVTLPTTGTYTILANAFWPPTIRLIPATVLIR